MKYIRENKDTGTKEIISEEDLRFRLRGNCKDVDLAVREINRRMKVETNFSIYYQEVA